MIDVQIKKEKITPKKCIDWAMSEKSGGINIFIGSVRDNTKGRTVKYLDYDVYENMALSEMKKIANYCKKKWEIHKILIHHRIGKLEVGDISVVIVVSAPHRKETFLACQYAIDTLKLKVPIWKKEIFEDGKEWVTQHP